MLINLIKALKAGNELSDPASWKKGQHLTNAVGALVMAVLTLFRYKWPDVYLPAELAEQLTQVIAAVLVTINLYLTPATTKKIGATPTRKTGAH